jgi:hypothetical protein
MSLMRYVNEEIDEARGLEYLRRLCVDRAIFHAVMRQVWKGQSKSRAFHPRGELIINISFSLVHVSPQGKRIVRCHQTTVPCTVKSHQSYHNSTFLVVLDDEGRVTGAYNDSLAHPTG